VAALHRSLPDRKSQTFSGPHEGTRLQGSTIRLARLTWVVKPHVAMATINAGILRLVQASIGSHGSSVSIVSDYGLDYQAIGARSPAGAKDFSSNLCVHTGSEAHSASCTMSTGGSFPEAKRGREVTLTTNPHLVPRSRMSRSYISSPLKRHRACSGTALLSPRQYSMLRSRTFVNAGWTLLKSDVVITALSVCVVLYIGCQHAICIT
jgi:hypothetical protein